jgi:hypothetical protein
VSRTSPDPAHFYYIKPDFMFYNFKQFAIVLIVFSSKVLSAQTELTLDPFHISKVNNFNEVKRVTSFENEKIVLIGSKSKDYRGAFAVMNTQSNEEVNPLFITDYSARHYDYIKKINDSIFYFSGETDIAIVNLKSMKVIKWMNLSSTEIQVRGNGDFVYFDSGVFNHYILAYTFSYNRVNKSSDNTINVISPYTGEVVQTQKFNNKNYYRFIFGHNFLWALHNNNADFYAINQNKGKLTFTKMPEVEDLEFYSNDLHISRIKDNVYFIQSQKNNIYDQGDNITHFDFNYLLFKIDLKTGEMNKSGFEFKIKNPEKNDNWRSRQTLKGYSLYESNIYSSNLQLIKNNSVKSNIVLFKPDSEEFKEYALNLKLDERFSNSKISKLNFVGDVKIKDKNYICYFIETYNINSETFVNNVLIYPSPF